MNGIDITKKQYLGDSVWMQKSNNSGIILTVEHGNGPEQTIFLDKYILTELISIALKLKENTDGNT